MASPFLAPRIVSALVDLPGIFRRVQEALDRVSRSGYILGLATRDLTPVCPSFQRVSPPAGGLRCVLPRADETNAGQSIILNVENPLGSLTIFPAPGQTVNGAATAVYTVGGVVELFSNGVNGWFGLSQLPAGGAGTPTWAQVLASGNVTAGVDPTISSGDALAFAVGATGITAAGDLSVNAVGIFEVDSTDMHLHPTGALHAGHEGFTASIHQGCVGAWDASCDSFTVQAGTTISASAGSSITFSTAAANRVIMDNAGAVQIVPGSFLQCGTAGPTASSPQIRSGDAMLRVRGTNGMSIGAGTSMSVFTTTGDAEFSADAGVVSLSGSTQSLVKLGGTARLNVQPTLTELSNGSQVRLTGSATGLNAALSWVTGGVARLTVLGNGEWSNPPGAANQYWKWQSGAFPIWSSLALSDLPSQAADTFLGRLAGAGTPTAQLLSDIDSTSIIYDAASHTFQRAALTSEVTASQNSNATTVTRSTNFQSSPWTGSHQFNACVVGANAFSTTLSGLGPSTDNLAIGAVNCVRITSFALDSLTGMVPSFDGQWVWLENVNAAVGLPIVHDSTSTAANRFYLPSNLAQVTLPARSGVWCRYDGTLARWVISDTQQFAGIGVEDVPGVTTVSGVRTLALDVGTGLSLSHSSTGSAPTIRYVATYAVDQATNWSWTGTHNFAGTTTWTETNTVPSPGAGKGAFWFRGDTPSVPMATGDTGREVPLQNGFGVNTSTTTITAATTVLATTQTITIPANTLKVGSKWGVDFTIKFVRGATATPLNMGCFLNVAGGAVSIGLPTPTAAGTYYVHARGTVTILTTGAGGTALAEITVDGSGVVGNTSSTSWFNAALAVNTTASQTIAGAAQMSAGVASCTMQCLGGHVVWLS